MNINIRTGVAAEAGTGGAVILAGAKKGGRPEVPEDEGFQGGLRSSNFV